MQSTRNTRLFKSYLLLLALIFFSPPMLRRGARLKLLIVLLFPCYLLLATCYHALAATPQKINYQGYVKNNGIPIDVATNFKFKICDAADCSGSLFCTETANAVPVVKGRFSHLIGTDPSCDLATVPWATNTLYLQILVEGQAMTPTEEIVSGPYSLNNDYGTPETEFILDRDNAGAGASPRLAFERGTSDVNDAYLTWDEAADEFKLTNDGAIFATLTLRVASAAFFVGDGSKLTGIGGGSDPTKVAKTGDTMTGPLLVNFNTATDSVKITNTGNGSALTIDNTGNTAATPSLYVKTSNANASSSSILADHSGAGVAGNFQINNVANGNNSVYVYTKGTGRAGYFDIDNPANSSAVLLGDTTGTGNLLQLQTGGVNSFVVDNTGNVYATGSFVSDVFTPGQRAFASTRGNVDGIYVQNPGTQGKAAQFLVTSGGNNNPTLTATNGGPGRAGFFQVNAPANATDTVFITTSSDNAASSLLGGNHSGSDGVLVRLKSGAGPGTEKLVVDKTGNVYASGSVKLPGMAYLNFGSTLGSGGFGFRDNSGIMEFKNDAGSWLPFGGGGNFVAKTGDTMTGPLLVNFNTATESLKITNTTGTGLMVDGNGATAATSALYVRTNNTNASGYAIRGDNSGAGYGVYGTNAGAGTGVYGNQTGTGYAVYGLNNNNSTGRAGYFYNTNSSNTVAALSGITVGTAVTSFGLYGEAAGGGRGVYGYNGGGGAGVLGTNSSNGFGVYGTTNGTGRAGFFQTINTGSATDTVFLTTNSNNAASSLLGGDHTGTAGNLIKLQSGGVDKFVLNKSGVLTTPLGFYTDGATASVYAYNYGTTNEAGHFELTDATTASSAIYGYTPGTAGTSHGVYGKSIGNGAGVFGENNGTGYGGWFEITNAANNNVAVVGMNAGNGIAGYFKITKAANNNPAVYGETNGGGDGIWAYQTGTGKAGAFQVVNTANAVDTVYATTNSNNALSTLFGGNHTGSAGNLLKLQSGGADKFVVDKNGVVTKSGCPANTNDNGGVWRWCVDDTPRAAVDFRPAVTTCAGAGGMLCNLGEWIAACGAEVFTYAQFEEHWINEPFGLGNSATMTPDGGTCGAGLMDIGNVAWGGTRKYLCCFQK